MIFGTHVNMKKWFFPLILILVFAAFAACSSTAKKRSFGEVVDDNVIAVKLRSKYVKDKYVKANHINVKVRKCVVQLDGSMDRQNQINRAIEIAEQQAGVKEVKAYIVLNNPATQLNNNKSKKSFFSFLKPKGKKSNDQTPYQHKKTVIETNLTDSAVANVKKDQTSTKNDDSFEDLGY